MLRGSLEDFSLSDIFRLLSFTKKTGRLEVRRSAGDGDVFFHDGEVYFAKSSFREEPLGQKLLRSGAVGQSELLKAMDRSAENGEGVGEILLREGAITEEQLSAAILEQIEDAAFELLRWDLGEFVFESGDRITVEVPISVSVENLIVQASRRNEELELIKRKIPSMDVVLAVAPTPPQGAREISITPDEWRMLVLVDGKRTVGQIVESAGVDEFTGLRNLHGLLAAGLAEVTSLGPTETPSPAHNPEAVKETSAPAVEEEVDGGERTVVRGPGEDVSKRDLYVAAEPAEADGDSEFGVEASKNGEVVAEAVDGDDEPVSFEPTEGSVVIAPEYDIDPSAHEDADLSANGFEPDVGVEEPVVPDADLEDPLIPETELKELITQADLQEPLLPEAETDEDLGSESSSPAKAGASGDESVQWESDAMTAEPKSSGGKSRFDRAAVVRELASLFRDEDGAMDAASSTRDDEDGSPEERKRKRRLEDDEDINKGLIGRLIDGVKGV